MDDEDTESNISNDTDDLDEELSNLGSLGKHEADSCSIVPWLSIPMWVPVPLRVLF